VAIGQVGSGSGSDRAGRVSLTFWKKSGRIGSIYMLYFFRSLIDFDWIGGHLISGRVGSGSDRVRVGSGSDPGESDGFVRSGRVLPPLSATVYRLGGSRSKVHRMDFDFIGGFNYWIFIFYD
jgi:hypothetical protein